jgi:hypothetical protein
VPDEVSLAEGVVLPSSRRKSRRRKDLAHIHSEGLPAKTLIEPKGVSGTLANPEPAPRALSYYDGADRIGAMIARPGAVDAFDIHGIHLGRFKTIKGATSAINTSLSGSCVSDTAARRDNSE